MSNIRYGLRILNGPVYNRLENNQALFSCQDSDVQAFMSATGITDIYINRAICRFVSKLKEDGVWNVLDSIYPFVGGNSTSHKFNLKNPLDTDAAFRLLFSGGWIHSSNGALPNGVNGYADTFFIPSVNASINGMAFGIYSRTEDISGAQNYGTRNSALNRFVDHQVSAGVFRIGAAITQIIYTASPTTRFMATRRKSNTFSEAYRDNTILGINTQSALSLPDRSFYLGAMNNGSNVAINYNAYELSFAFLSGQEISESNILNLNSAVDQLQIDLNRNV